MRSGWGRPLSLGPVRVPEASCPMAHTMEVGPSSILLSPRSWLVVETQSIYKAVDECQKHVFVLPVDEVAPEGDGKHSVLSFKALDLVILAAFHVDVRANTLVLKAESVELNLKGLIL